ncbi:MAG TPA: hypothetical protein VIN40_06240 [Candidatus Tyrphobacter sp.]
MSTNDHNAVAIPHFFATASVKWTNRNDFLMVTLTDHPNLASVGSRIDCARTP